MLINFTLDLNHTSSIDFLIDMFFIDIFSEVENRDLFIAYMCLHGANVNYR